MAEQLTSITEETVAFTRDGLTLRGVLAYPADGEPQRLVLLCAPHPNFAGDMQNNVIVALARGLADAAVTLRFDYHGIGASQIALPPGVSVFDYWQEVEESRDYAAAVRDTATAADFLSFVAPALQLTIVGYSFGAAAGLCHGLADPRATRLAGLAPPLARVDFSFLAGLAKPCLLLCGGKDFVCAAPDLQALAARAGAQARILPEEDHFFRGTEQAVLDIVSGFLNQE